MYLPVTAAGYFIFGSLVDDNMLTTIFHVSNGPALYIVQILIVFHLMFGYVIVMNPISQELEEALNIPHCEFLFHFFYPSFLFCLRHQPDRVIHYDQL